MLLQLDAILLALHDGHGQRRSDGGAFAKRFGNLPEILLQLYVITLPLPV